MAAALEIEGLSKRYGGFQAVRDLDLKVEAGEIFGFLGPNGAGKTTTLRMVLGLIPPTSGRIAVLGSTRLVACRDRIGFLPEERGLYRRMTPLQSVVFFAGLKGVASSVARRRGREMLEAQGLGEALHRPMKALSKRLCRRVALMARGAKVFDGTVAEARAHVSQRLVFEGALDAEAVRALPGVMTVGDDAAADGPGSRRLSATLSPGAEPQAALKAAFQRDLDITQFRVEAASLHDAFIALTGGQP